MVLADVSGDGKADVVTDNNRGISVLIGDGSGNFAPHLDYQGSAGAASIAAGDVNGDGKIDVISVTDGARSVNAFLNDGSGHFPSHVDSSMHNEPFHLAVGDFNGDGKLDVVTANRGTTHAASVLLGNGDGTFALAKTFAVRRSVAGVGGVAAADINSDGKLDFVLLSSGSVWVFLGRGDGTFADPVETPNLYLTSIQIGDFNRDGKLDIFAPGTSSAWQGGRHFRRPVHPRRIRKRRSFGGLQPRWRARCGCRQQQLDSGSAQHRPALSRKSHQ